MNAFYRWFVVTVLFDVCFITGHAWAASKKPNKRPPPRILITTDPAQPSPEHELLMYALEEQIRNTTGFEMVTPSGQQPSDARAEKLRIEGTRLLTDARTQFDNLDIEACEPLATQAVAKLETVASMTGDIRALPNALALLGAIQFMLGQEKKADALFEKLICIAPNYVPDPSIFQTQLQGHFNKLFNSITARPLMQLEVTTNPPGATVSIDGHLMGPAPIVISNVLPGPHYVRVVKSGFTTSGKFIQARGKSLSLEMFLPQIPFGSAFQNPPTPIFIDTVPPISQALQSLAEDLQASYALIVSVSNNIVRVFLYDIAHNTGTVRTAPMPKPGALAALQLAPSLISDELPALLATPFQRGKIAIALPTPPKPPEPIDLFKLNNPTIGHVVKLKLNKALDFALGPPNHKSKAIAGLYITTTVALVAAGVLGTMTYFESKNYNKESDGPPFIMSQTTDQIEGHRMAKQARIMALSTDIAFGIAATSLGSALILRGTNPISEQKP